MKKKVLIIIDIILVILIIISGYKIITWLLNNNDTVKTLEEVKEKAVIKDIELNTTTAHKIDFNNLKDINKDSIAWLVVNNTNIDYPVVQSSNNDYYLNHNFYKEKSDTGWPYLDYRNKLSDKNIIIYAHNRLDNSMFGSLKKLKKNGWLNNLSNRQIVLTTRLGNIEYEIFSIYEVKEENYYLTTVFNDKEYEKFLNTLKKRSMYDLNVDLTNTKQVITLSTCTTDNGSRLVVHAKRK